MTPAGNWARGQVQAELGSAFAAQFNESAEWYVAECPCGSILAKEESEEQAWIKAAQYLSGIARAGEA